MTLEPATLPGQTATMTAIPVAKLNHAVLFVRDATQAAEFYGRVFGFEVVESAFGGRAVFMRARGGDNHHDLGLFSVGGRRPGRRAPRPACTTWPGRSRPSRTWPRRPARCARPGRSAGRPTTA